MKPLKAYLVQNSIKNMDFAARIGVTPSRLSQLLSDRGDRPSLPLAAIIERETGGAVSMLGWAPVDKRRRQKRSVASA